MEFCTLVIYTVSQQASSFITGMHLGPIIILASRAGGCHCGALQVLHFEKFLALPQTIDWHISLSRRQCIRFVKAFSTLSLNQSISASLLIRHSVYPLLHLQNKVLALLFQLDTLSIQTQTSLLGLLITFVNNFHFNLVVMFAYFVNQSSVLHLFYSEKHCFIVYRICLTVKSHQTWKAVFRLRWLDFECLLKFLTFSSEEKNFFGKIVSKQSWCRCHKTFFFTNDTPVE